MDSRAAGAGSSERHADWAELFFDLVFVLAVAEIDRGFVEEPTATRALVTLALFVPVWWAWTGFAFFATRFPADNRGTRLALLAAGGASLVMAVGLGSAVEGDGVVFALGYGLLRMVLALVYWLSRGEEPDRRSLAEAYARDFGVGALLWLVSTLVPPPWRYVLWAVGILIDLTAPVRHRLRLQVVPIDTSHLPERFGTFVLIVLGETLAATGEGVGATDWDAAAVVTAVACFVAACAVWWSYFDRVDAVFMRPFASRSDSGIYARNIYSYGHFPVVVGIVAMAAGAKLLIGDEGIETGGIALAVGLALVLASLGGLQLAIARSGVSRVARARLIAAACCLPIVLLAVFGLGRIGLAVLVAAVGVAVCGWVQVHTQSRAGLPRHD